MISVRVSCFGSVFLPPSLLARSKRRCCWPHLIFGRAEVVRGSRYQEGRAFHIGVHARVDTANSFIVWKDCTF